jgi:peroxiredoxin
MTLQETLRQFKAGVVTRVSPADVAVMEQATADLLNSGILQKTKKVGDRAPDFTLPDAAGEVVRLATLLARGPVVVTFFRGTWWPYCNLQLQAYQAILPELKALGASLVAISPQTPDHSLSLAEKHNLGFELLSDVGNQVARHYGLVFSLPEPLRELYIKKFGVDLKDYNADEAYELPLPGTFIVARNGTITFAFVDADYTVRMEPGEIVAKLQEICGPGNIRRWKTAGLRLGGVDDLYINGYFI